MSVVKHLHSSSRYDRVPVSIERAARAYSGSGFDLLTWTEVERPLRRLALARGLGEGWESSHGRGNGNADDCAISWRTSRFRLVHAEQTLATRLRVRRKGSSKLRDPLYASYAVLHDVETGKRLAVAVVHLPSAVERDLARRRRTARALQWYAAVRGTKRRLNKLARIYKAHGRLLVADWNVNLKRPWARTLVKAIAPRYTLAWRSFPRGGTHGRRLIDAAIYRGAISAWSGLWADDKSSDHRPFTTTLTWMGVR